MNHAEASQIRHSLARIVADCPPAPSYDLLRRRSELSGRRRGAAIVSLVAVAVGLLGLSGTLLLLTREEPRHLTRPLAKPSGASADSVVAATVAPGATPSSNLVPFGRSLRAGWIEDLDARLRTQYPADFGGAYISNGVVVVNARNTSHLGSVLDAIEAAPLLTEGDQGELQIYTRPTRLTYAEFSQLVPSILDGQWLGTPLDRVRSAVPDYDRQLIVVAVFNLTESDVQGAIQEFGDLVVVNNSQIGRITGGPATAELAPSDSSIP